MPKPLRQLLRIKDTYPHDAALRGQVGVFRKMLDDGTVLVRFEEGPHKGVVCFEPKYVESVA